MAGSNGHNGNGHLKKGQAAFLAAYRTMGNISAAAKAAGVHRQSHYLWLERDPEYVAEFAQADEEAIEWLEAEARRRAVEGTQRLKFHQGQLVTIPDPENPEGPPIPYVEHEFSDTLLIFLLKGRRPEVYRERYEHTGEVDVNVREVTVTVPRVGRLSE